MGNFYAGDYLRADKIYYLCFIFFYSEMVLVMRGRLKNRFNIARYICFVIGGAGMVCPIIFHPLYLPMKIIPMISMIDMARVAVRPIVLCGPK